MQILIFGAGAIGTTLGYLLTKKNKNNVTFLVRETKVSNLKGSTIPLYWYDKKKAIPFSGFDVMSTDSLESNVQDQDFQKFELIVMTLHTDILLSETGKQLIQKLSSKLSPTCKFLSLSPGFRLPEETFGPAGVNKNRLSFGLPLFLCHEVPMTGQPEDPKYNDRHGAKYAFHFLVSGWFPLLVSKNPDKVISTAIKGAGGRIMNFGNSVLEASTVIFLILNLMLNLQNYPASLDKKDERFTVAIKAFKQTMNNYGLIGTGMKITMGKNMFKLTDWVNRKMTLPLTMEFIKYHHGHKVLEQNVGVVRGYIEYGKANNKKVDAIEEFCGYFETKEAPPQAQSPVPVAQATTVPPPSGSVDPSPEMAAPIAIASPVTLATDVISSEQSKPSSPPQESAGSDLTATGGEEAKVKKKKKNKKKKKSKRKKERREKE
eukprot:maker-scaffold_35-snap-gene-2.89-mRNA-1 protein AED:0.00 eAED:0.00 QI:143/1/1/1/1/1/2/75/431